MKSIKFYKILSITLLILNLVTLSIFFISGPPGPPRPGEAHLAEEIGLTGTTKKKVDALEIKHHKDKRALMRHNFQLQKKLYNALTDEETSSAILEQIHANRSETDRMTFEFFSEVATQCNQKQRKKLDEIIDHGLRRITNHPGPPPKK
ncbi:hypothetical protein N9Y60_04080 [Crocinitomicaceae bacterium]|nr:hypothetical protein [Crocinitomicaceae bacterium]